MTTSSEATCVAEAATETPFAVLQTRTILLAMTQLGGLQVVLALTGLVRNKVAAIYLNTSGMGEWSQVQGLATIAFTVIQLGMIVGLSRNTAAATTAGDRQRQLSVANTLITMVGVFSLAATVALYLNPSTHSVLARLGISSRLELVTLLFIVLVAPFEGFRNNFLSFLQGLLDIRGIATKRAIAVVVATVAAVPLVAMLGITGACLQFALGSLLLALLLGHRCRQLGYAPLRFDWERSSAIKLASLGVASLLVTFAASGVDVLIRAQLIRHAGLSEAGIYQAAFLLSSQVTQIALGSIGVFSLASVSKKTQADVISGQLHSMYRVIIPVATIGLGLLGLLERPVVRLLFSSQFNSSAELLPLLLMANAAQATCWVAGAPLLGCGRVGTWLSLQLVGATIRYGAASVLLPVMGTQAIPLAMLIGQAFDLSTSLVICSRVMKIRTSGGDLTKIGVSTALPGVAAWLGLFATPAAFGVGLLALGGGALVLAPGQVSRYTARAARFALRRWAPSKPSPS
jgi:O-antigen/teichoic acid export membrane protein